MSRQIEEFEEFIVHTLELTPVQVELLTDAKFRTAMGHAAILLANCQKELDFINKKFDEETRLRKNAETDQLTGLLTRAAFLRETKDLVNSGTRIAIIMADAKSLKAVNDEFGHGAGDRYLVDMAATIFHLMRDGSVVGRWGGDEMIMAFECSDEDELDTVMGRLRSVFSGDQHGEISEITDEFAVPLSARFDGDLVAYGDPEDIDTTIEAADLKMRDMAENENERGKMPVLISLI